MVNGWEERRKWHFVGWADFKSLLNSSKFDSKELIFRVKTTSSCSYIKGCLNSLTSLASENGTLNFGSFAHYPNNLMKVVEPFEGWGNFKKIPSFTFWKEKKKSLSHLPVNHFNIPRVMYPLWLFIAVNCLLRGFDWNSHFALTHVVWSGSDLWVGKWHLPLSRTGFSHTA